jgi:transposase
VYWYFTRWEQAGVTEKILPVVREQLRLADGRNAEPSAGLSDSQSVQGADTVGRETRGYDAGKKINERKRFIVTDTPRAADHRRGLRREQAGPQRRQVDAAAGLSGLAGAVRVH